MVAPETLIDVLKIKTSHYIIGSVALVAALSWNTTVEGFINECIPATKDKMNANIIYSIVITIILCIMIILLPDTEKELPKLAQEKIRESKEKSMLKQRIYNLEREIIHLKQNQMLN